MNDPFSIVVCLPDGVDHFDPDPDLTASKDVRLVTEWAEDTQGVVGWSDGAWRALDLAAAHPELPRLVIASLPFPDDAATIPPVAAKTLLLFGQKDPRTGSAHGTQWQRSLPDARLEMVPGAGHELLTQMWKRVLSHLAPRRKA